MPTTLSLYDMTVPIFVKRTQQLIHVTRKGEQWCNENDKPTSTLMEARIYHDMEPFPFQIQTCYRMIIYFFSRLEIAPVPAELPQVTTTLEELYKHLDEMLVLLASASRESFENKHDQELKFGPPTRKPWDFTGLTFAQNFILPNFYFHTTTAYDILRMLGVPLGKLDFIGLVPAT
ncbi:hypothetical protein K431DRAFT_278564 [Polychaeton citri CBS 116435]|uniref:DUF1993 domain-containing protein n=1 Tax=Polychaeton citri CBS 116435 TaxID=1314669 RepID=A0A9P4Q216_9PEZI|nr:hypothetical protein K431DRAFT_278564 [Polychaeton citri CBS 116435]